MQDDTFCLFWLGCLASESMCAHGPTTRIVPRSVLAAHTHLKGLSAMRIEPVYV